MKLRFLFMPAFAGLLTATPFPTAPDGNMTMTTLVKTQITTLTSLPPAAPSLSKRWNGDCEKFCRTVYGYWRCMAICLKREGSSTDTEHPEDSDFVDEDKPLEFPKDPSLPDWVWDGPPSGLGTDTPSGSDAWDWNDRDRKHHDRRSVDSAADNIYTTDEHVNTHVRHMVATIRAYGAIFRKLNTIHNAVQRPDDDVPRPIGPQLDEYIQAWLVGLRNSLGRPEDTRAWSEELVRHVLESQEATAQFYARRLEVLARRDTEPEMTEMMQPLGKETKKAIRKAIRMTWRLEFGAPVWTEVCYG